MYFYAVAVCNRKIGTSPKLGRENLILVKATKKKSQIIFFKLSLSCFFNVFVVNCKNDSKSFYQPEQFYISEMSMTY